MFARHVKGLTVHNLEVRGAKDEQRPAVMLDDVTDVTFELARLRHLPTVPTFVLKNVARFSVSSSRGISDTRRETVVIDEKL